MEYRATRQGRVEANRGVRGDGFVANRAGGVVGDPI